MKSHQKLPGSAAGGQAGLSKKEAKYPPRKFLKVHLHEFIKKCINLSQIIPYFRSTLSQIPVP